jgi:hypothetical protein
MEEFGQVCPKEKMAKRNLQRSPSSVPKQKERCQKRFKRSPFESMQKKKSKKKGSQIKFKRNPIKSAPKKKKGKKKFQNSPSNLPKQEKKVPPKKGSHPISPPIFCPDPQF